MCTWYGISLANVHLVQCGFVPHMKAWCVFSDLPFTNTDMRVIGLFIHAGSSAAVRSALPLPE